MPAFPRDDSDPADDEIEAQSWSTAFGKAKPKEVPPLTEEERATITSLMIRARENDDIAALDRLAELAKDPAAFRQAMAGFQEAAPEG